MQIQEVGVKKDRIKGKWLQLVDDIRQRWGRFPGDEINTANGEAEKLIWKWQERYGYARDPGRDLDEVMVSVSIASKPKSTLARIPSVPIDLIKNPGFEDRLR
jgi:uncharacterized protein YjbJ (UPF0337 family)